MKGAEKSNPCLRIACRSNLGRVNPLPSSACAPLPRIICKRRVRRLQLTARAPKVLYRSVVSIQAVAPSVPRMLGKCPYPWQARHHLAANNTCGIVGPQTHRRRYIDTSIHRYIGPSETGTRNDVPSWHLAQCFLSPHTCAYRCFAARYQSPRFRVARWHLPCVFLESRRFS